MKKSIAILVWIVVGILIVVGCVFAFIYFTSKPVQLPSKESGDSVVDENNERSGDVVVSDEPIFSKDNYPRVDASLAIQPLAEAIKKNFVPSGDVQEIDMEYLNTHEGFLGVVDGTRDVCFMSYPSDEEMAYAKEKGVELEIVRATNSAFVFIVNVDNPVNNLTLQQIKDIYSGKITNWKDVGGEDAEIIPYQRPVNSGSQSGMLQLVMKDTPLMTPPTMELTVGMGDLVDAVAQYDNSRYAIGYSYYYYVNTMYKRDKIKILAVDGIPANKETISTGEYPIMTSGWLVFRKDEPASSMTRKWVQAVTSERGAKIIEAEGYVPAN